MLYLFLSVLSSVTIALLIKSNENANLNRLTVLIYNYVTISLILLAVVVIQHSFYFSIKLFLFGMIVGFLFAANFFIYMRLVNSSDISLPTLAMRLSLVIPITFSVILYGESVNIMRGAGFLLALLSIVMMYDPSGGKSDIFLMLILFLFSGLSDFSMKFFEMNFKLIYETVFLFFLFSWAGIFSILFLFFYKKSSGKKEIYNGIVLAIPNLLASFFLILALKRISASVAFPIANISVIVLSAVGSKLLFEEFFSKRKLVSFALGTAAVVILSIVR